MWSVVKTGIGTIKAHSVGDSRAYPHIVPDLRITNTPLDFDAISRHGRRVGTLGIGVYASRAYAQKYRERRLSEHRVSTPGADSFLLHSGAAPRLWSTPIDELNNVGLLR